MRIKKEYSFFACLFGVFFLSSYTVVHTNLHAFFSLVLYIVIGHYCGFPVNGGKYSIAKWSRSGTNTKLTGKGYKGLLYTRFSQEQRLNGSDSQGK